METEIPAMLLARQTIGPERFTFQPSRMCMKEWRRRNWPLWTRIPKNWQFFSHLGDGHVRRISNGSPY
jgi:hypothetical protein